MKKQELKNTIVQILYWSTNVCVAAFTTGYLTKFGFSNLSIGLIMSVSAIITIFMNFYIDDALDYLVLYHLKKTVISTYLICFILCALFLFHNKADIITLILFATICSLMTHNQRLVNILCERQKHEHILIDGNRPANLGLLGYGLITLIMGYIISKTTVTIILPCYLVFIVITVIVTSLFLKDETEKQPEINVSLQYHEAIKIIKTNKRFTLFLLASLFSAIGSMAALKYLVRVVNSLGGNAFNHAIALTIQTLITIPISKKSKNLLEKYDSEILLLISYIFSFLKIFFLYIANNLYMVYLAMACSLLGYGLFGFSSANLTKKLNNSVDEPIAHKLALLFSSFGFGPLIGGIVGGMLMQFTTLKFTMLCCSLLTFIAVIIQYNLNKKFKA